jgi:ribosomal-protein-alanine N-acetyltransferase
LNVIEAGGLTLEPQVAAHAAEMFVVLGDPALYEFENEPPASVEWLRTRYTKLESRLSADGQERWLNWVIRIPTGELIGYVQATVFADGHAAIAYELASAYWGRGLALRAVQAMIEELFARYRVRSLSAVFKRGNFRSRRLLERLGFAPASGEQHRGHALEPGEMLMVRDLGEELPRGRGRER